MEVDADGGVSLTFILGVTKKGFIMFPIQLATTSSFLELFNMIDSAWFNAQNPCNFLVELALWIRGKFVYCSLISCSIEMFLINLKSFSEL